MRVTPDYEKSSLRISSLGASLFGFEDSNRTKGDDAGAVSWGVVSSGAPPPPPPVEATSMAKDDALLSGAEGQRLVNGLERGLRAASLAFNTTLTWEGGLARSRSGPDRGNFTRLSTTVQVRLGVDLPPPFTLVPRLLVQGAVSQVMRGVTQLIVPQFVALLEQDYGRWRNGTRDASVAVGSLMAETELLGLGEGSGGT